MDKNGWILITEDNLPLDGAIYLCYGEDWAGYPIFDAIYDIKTKTWVDINNQNRQFPTHYKIA